MYYNDIDLYCADWLRALMAEGIIPRGDVDTRRIEDVKAHEISGYTQCHFFAGLGGWAYAARLAGWPDDRPLWTGSCPCQPFSNAGKRRGARDPRHLWPHMFRLVQGGRPAVLIGPDAKGKYRRIKPGVRLLAHGVPARVPKLRAFGNTFVAEVAAEVIRAHMETAA